MQTSDKFIINASSIFELIIYADDSTLSATLNHFSDTTGDLTTDERINLELDKICTWLDSNKLSLNVTKTKYMIFHQPQKKFRPLKLKMDTDQIECVDSFNFLGIVIDKHLTWKSHVEKIASIISRSLGTLNRLKRILPLEPKIQIYNSIILSHVNYGILVWGFNCSKINKLQKKAVRILSCSKYNAHTDPLLKKLRLLKAEDIFTLCKIKFYYRFLHGLLPANLLNLPLTSNIEIHNYNTRQIGNIFIHRYNHSFAKHCIR